MESLRVQNRQRDLRTLVEDYTSQYSQYVATSRSIPSLLDGLKPSQRRCILSARDLGIYHNKKYLKAAKLEGDVIGNYHPHGGVSIAGLVQPFTTRYPLFEGQGNWGSPDMPGSVAASRYVEARLTKFTEDFYLDSADYADTEDNYDGRLKEITLFYPPIPGSLLTGAQGIAVGLSTYIPSHNVKDVCESLLKYIEQPCTDGYLENLMPDTCEESIILTPKHEIKKMYETGTGSISYKAKTHRESINGKHALVVDAFPPGYSKKRLETAPILEAVENGVLELVNESKEGIRYVFTSSDESILDSIEERLTNSVGYRFFIEHRGVIKCYKLKEIYDVFLEDKCDFIRRKYSDLASRETVELEYLNILLLFKQDKKYIKDMFDKTSDEVIQDIISKYNTTEKIARRIVNTTLRSLMADNLDQINTQIENLKDTLDEYNHYVEDPVYKLKKEISELLESLSYDKRRAVHIDDVSLSTEVVYRGQTLSITPSKYYYVGTPDNKVSKVSGNEVLCNNLYSEEYILEESGYKYYVLYDRKGICSMEESVLDSDNKFKSDNLVGIIGTDDLSKVHVTMGNGKTQPLADWTLRKRSSYIRMAEDNQPDIIVS